MKECYELIKSKGELVRDDENQKFWKFGKYHAYEYRVFGIFDNGKLNISTIDGRELTYNAGSPEDFEEVKRELYPDKKKS